MALGTKVKWTVAFLALAIAASPAVAKQKGDSGEGGVRSDAKLDSIVPAKVATQDQVFYGELLVQRIESVATSIRKQLEVARGQRDVVKVLCLNDKLNQVDVAKRAAKDRLSALKAANEEVKSGKAASRDAATHEFTILITIQRRSDQLGGEANSCVGQEEASLGQAKVVQTVGNNLPPVGRETDFPPSDPNLVTEVPKCTSCVR